MRLYNFLKQEFNLTKSEEKEFFKNHDIKINDKPAKELSIIDFTSNIFIDGKLYKYIENKSIYIAFNKPIGIECTNDIKKENNIISFINYKERIFPIGRLDKDSHGLIILTNDFNAPNEFLNKDNHVEKEYIVKTKEIIDLEFVDKMSKPILLNNKYTKPCVTKLIDEHTFNIILKEGMYRQIRRMAKSLNKTVIDLKRIRFGNLYLDIDEGKYREINKDNI